MTDPIADMLIRIKNAYLARKKSVVIPHSGVKEAIAQVLADNKYIESFEKKDVAPQAEIIAHLRYVDNHPAMTDMRRVSKPGRRTYAPASRVIRTLGGYGITVVSTSSGVMSDRDAKKKNIGGEVLCQVW